MANHLIQTVLRSIYETTTEGEELLINKLYKLTFDSHLKTDQIIFNSSRLISSELNLFQYLDSKCGVMGKMISFRAKIINFLKEYIIYYSSYCINYLDYIHKMTSAIYRLEQSQILKEKILSLTAKILLTFPLEQIDKIYKPKEYLESLLNEIKLNKLKTSIKGGIWHIIGILISKFSLNLQEYKIEVHDVLFSEFIKECSNHKHFEFKAVIGMLRSYLYLLEDAHLTASQIKQLYIVIKSLTKPLDDANTIKINKLALEVLGTHGKVFSLQLQSDSLNLFGDVLALCNHKNYELKIAANDAMEKISLHISDCLLEESDFDKDVFHFLLRQIGQVLEMKNASIMTNTAISLIGIFSNAIVRFSGEHYLKKYLEELIVICDKEILSSLGKEAYHQAKRIAFTSEGIINDNSKYKPSKSIKYILAIQKQYISILNAYANIISNLNEVNELFAKHFYNVLLIGFSTHTKFYIKYKETLGESISNVIVSMAKHKEYFLKFLRKVIKNGFIESIRVTPNMIFKEASEKESIINSVNFWLLLITRDKVLTEYTVNSFFNELMKEITELINNLDISYKEIINENNNVSYESNNVSDLEIYTRTCEFITEFVIKAAEHKRVVFMLMKWVFTILKIFIQRANDYPRVGMTYKVIGAIMKFCDGVCFFDNNNNNISNNNGGLLMLNINNDEISDFKDSFKLFN